MCRYLPPSALIAKSMGSVKSSEVPARSCGDPASPAGSEMLIAVSFSSRCCSFSVAGRYGLLGQFSLLARFWSRRVSHRYRSLIEIAYAGRLTLLDNVFGSLNLFLGIGGLRIRGCSADQQNCSCE
jgi:hypothetical protein